MIYRVIMDGNDILNFQERQFVLLNPVLNTELNTAGSFEFTMPPSHTFYDDINPLASTIEVYENETLLWFGRPVEVRMDYYSQKLVYCEGALSFFNDSVQRAYEYESVRNHTFFEDVVTAHNAQVDSSRRFTVGNITVSNEYVERKLNYESTFDVLKTQCIDEMGGYLFVRRENGVNYIDWLKDMPYTCNQPVEFGLNLLNLTSCFDVSSIATCVIPLGATDMDTDETLTIKSVNNGSDTIESEAVSTYGRITKAVTFPDITDASVLYAAGADYLENLQFDNLVIECTAAELHLQNEEYEQFRVGQMIYCWSVPHLIGREFPLTKLSIRLDTAAKKITLGTEKHPPLSKFYTEVWEPGANDEENPATEAEIERLETQIGNIQTQVGVVEGRVDNLSGSSGSDGFRHWVGTLGAYKSLSGINSATLYFIIPG